MSTGSYLNADGLLQQYGTQKTIPEQGGDYKAYGLTRYIEVLIDLTSLTTTAQVQSLTTFFPAGYNVIIEKVEIYADIGATTGTSFSVGLGYFSGSTYANITTHAESSTSSSVTTTAYTANLPGITSISDTAFVAALTTTNVATAGDYVTINQTTNSSFAGAYVGAAGLITNTTNPCYITAKSAGSAYTTGLMRVRIFYRGYGTIFN